ncbi:MAG: EEP domain-containing protein [Halieaceae bacterium]|jgi:endonuclease/exonuclease/phosphatase family metal-dependent hydrolase|nr:EEP domain-containing protein [Halieaceae bacterium]
MSSPSTELRTCTYNIHKGVCTASKRPILPELRHAIRTVDADLVFLQEVVGEHSATALVSAFRRAGVFSYPQFEYLADEVWPHHAYGRNAIYQRGHHGNAILSKNQFLHWDNFDVSQWWFSQRGILLGKLAMGVYVVCVHFGLFSRERKKQLQKLLALLAKKVPDNMPLIIAGDFNDWKGKLHRRLVDEMSFQEAYSTVYGRPARTFPARLPFFSMDRIYYRNLKLIDAEVLSGAPWRRLSDHRALYAVFDIAGIESFSN